MSKIKSPKRKRKSTPPKSRVFNVQLSPTRTAKVQVEIGTATTYRRAILVGLHRAVRENGKVKLFPVELPSVKVTIKIGNHTLAGRSLCRPPDHFDPQAGRYFALHSLFRNDLKHVLSRSDRKHLTEYVCASYISRLKGVNGVVPSHKPPDGGASDSGVSHDSARVSFDKPSADHANLQHQKV